MSQRNEISQIISGVLLLLGLHILAVKVYTFLGLAVKVTIFNKINTLLGYAVLGIGISQLLYVVPLIILLKQLQEWGLMKGVIIGAVLTALLNGGCWLLVYSVPR